MPEATERLLRVTRESLDRAIAQVKVAAGCRTSGTPCRRGSRSHGFSIVREFVGHGIGEQLHEEPQIPNYGQPGRGPRLAEGMVLAIEPMVAMGRPETKVLADGWTAVTRDGSLAAHFEHTVAVSAGGPLVLTARRATRRLGAVPVAVASVAVTGTVLAVLPRALYRVAVDDGREVVAHAASGAGRNFVRLVVGDRGDGGVECAGRDARSHRPPRVSESLRSRERTTRERRGHEGQGVGEADL